MSVDYDAFLIWATERFGEENIKLRKDEICTHSFFARDAGIEDNKYHLWMNPSGGKKELPHGAYRCWKTDAMGSLVSLVSMLDNIPFDEAEELICDTLSLRALEAKLDAFMENLYGPSLEVSVAEMESSQQIALPPHTYRITKMTDMSSWKRKATQYLQSRKLPVEPFYVCIDGNYSNRIVIPYYNRDGVLIWYNARTMSKKQSVLKYMKPDLEDDSELTQENVLYFPKWPRKGQKVYITEGEFDAYSLFLSELIGGACGGKFLSETQINMLRDYTVVLVFDGDKWGKGAVIDNGEQLLQQGFQPRYVRPPAAYKDWNKLLEKKGPEAIRAYIERYEKPYTQDTRAILLAQAV